MTPRRGALLAALRQAAAARSGGFGADISVERDIAYGAHARQRLDLYRPAPGGPPRPLMLFVHGGGWRRGDKALPRMVAHKVSHWVPRGWVFAAMNYRLWPEVDVPAQAGDVAQALAHLQRQAGALGLDAERIVLVGHSAGAQLAALLLASPEAQRRAGLRPWHATVLIDTAALDMVAVMQRPHHAFYDPIFGRDPGYWRRASATLQMVEAPPTPVLLVCAAARDDALTAARGFAARVQALGGRAGVRVVALDHLALNAALGSDPTYTALVDAFLADPERETPHGDTRPPS